jgi:hypothetical protein
MSQNMSQKRKGDKEMKFKGIVEGNVIDIKKTKTGKQYVLVYDGTQLNNVFTSKKYNVGEHVFINVDVMADKVYIREAEG